jgi:4-amino-4-deoxy-L-arabinose transferase-like glycosyltransferase
MEFLKNKIIKNRVVLFLLFIYFCINLPNLTRLPIFNDESIYLDWGWFNTHFPGHLYDSLLDSKQPLMVWIFGIFENFFKDPLFAGRFVSVMIGSITALGIFTIAKKLLNESTAIIAIFLYSITPIFVFYNRQALMEASIACIGIWSFNAILNLLHKPSMRYGVILGIILGIGFLSKSSSLLFVVSSIFVVLFYSIIKKRAKFMKYYLISLLTFICVNIILFINPFFWQTLSSNSRYSLTLTDILTSAFSYWVNHLFGFFEIGFIFITPLVFIYALVGAFIMLKNKIKECQVFFVYFGLALLLEILSVRSQNQRYIVSFLPFLVISASYILGILLKGNLLKKTTAILSFFIPLILSFLIIFHPENYIMQLSKVSNYSEVSYILGQTSGYGINEVMEYIREHSSISQPSIILAPLNIGNPESAVDLYSQKSSNLVTLHIDASFFPKLSQYKCLNSEYPVFFVTRDDQRAGMDSYFSLEKSFPNPYSNYSVKIYNLKKNCSGNTLSLSDFYQNTVNFVMQMKQN